MPPPMDGFKPFGIAVRQREAVVLLFEEFEAIRLTDYENLTQEEAAEKMKISRPTFTRLYDKARKSIARAFVEGNPIVFSGGDYITDDYWYKCKDCFETMITLKPADHCRTCDSENLLPLDKGRDKTK